MPLVCPSANCRAPPVLKPFLVSYSCPLLVPPNQPVPVFLFYSPSDRYQTLCSLKLPFHDPSSYLVPLSFSFLFHPFFNCRSSSAHFNSRRSRYLAVSGQTMASLSRTNHSGRHAIRGLPKGDATSDISAKCKEATLGRKATPSQQSNCVNWVQPTAVREVHGSLG